MDVSGHVGKVEAIAESTPAKNAANVGSACGVELDVWSDCVGFQV